MNKQSSFDSLETDNRISLHFSIQEDTRDTDMRFAGTRQEFRFNNLRRLHDHQQGTVTEQQQQPELYQCSSKQDDDLGSESDSAKEEDSPYGSIELPKTEALVPSGAEKENSKIRNSPQTQNQSAAQTFCQAIQPFHTPAPIIQNDPHSLQEAMEESTDNFGQCDSIVPTGCRNDRPKERKNPFEDLDVRLATFLTYMPEWPHKKPSAEEMAAAGMVFMGVFHMKERNETVYDMVECYKCRKRMYAFTETDDPKAEHKKLYPHCL